MGNHFKSMSYSKSSRYENEMLRILLDVSQSLYQYINIDDMILNIIRLIKKLIKVEAVSVILHDEKKDEFVFRWAEDERPGAEKKLKEIRFPIDQGIAGSVFSTGKPEMILDIEKNPHHFKTVDEKTKSETKSMIAVPLQKKEKIIGVLEVHRVCEKIIDSDITILIEGETGTGKEVVARCIHFNSPRRDKPFVTQNCGDIPETLLFSELFGHTRGSFTGAIADKKGLFEIADGGTVFLDEVAEMSPLMQTSLLRVLQEGEIKPLGSDYSKKINARVISATNKNLEDQVNKGNSGKICSIACTCFPLNFRRLRKEPETSLFLRDIL